MSGVSLSVVDLECRYRSVLAVDHVAFEIAAGEHVALMGANGSGKSTLLRAIGGLQTPSTGTVCFDDQPVTAATARRRSAWIPQRQGAGRFPLLVDELLASSGDPDAAGVAGDALGLGDLRRRPLSTLSGGQLQRAFAARAIGSIAAGAGVLLADEPTAALDFEGQAELASRLRRLEVTVVLATHDRAVAAACDRTIEMAAGRVREIT